MNNDDDGTYGNWKRRRRREGERISLGRPVGVSLLTALITSAAVMASVALKIVQIVNLGTLN